MPEHTYADYLALEPRATSSTSFSMARSTRWLGHVGTRRTRGLLFAQLHGGAYRAYDANLRVHGVGARLDVRELYDAAAEPSA